MKHDFLKNSVLKRDKFLYYYFLELFILIEKKITLKFSDESHWKHMILPDLYSQGTHPFHTL